MNKNIYREKRGETCRPIDGGEREKRDEEKEWSKAGRREREREWKDKGVKIYS